MTFRIRCEHSFPPEASFDLDWGHNVLFRYGVPQDRHVAPMEKIEDPVMNPPLAYSQLVDSVTQ